jgi:hypothetical protein
MSFMNVYKRTEINGGVLSPVLSKLDIESGVYNEGLITIFDAATSEIAMSSWRWLLGTDAIAFAANAFGDIFFWSESQGAVYFLESQFGRSTFIDKDIDFVMNSFLIEKGIQENVLHSDLFILVKSRVEALSYGECYIAEPWIMLGGSGKVETYSRGNIVVYLSLIGQAVHQLMENKKKAKKGVRFI